MENDNVNMSELADKMATNKNIMLAVMAMLFGADMETVKQIIKEGMTNDVYEQ